MKVQDSEYYSAIVNVINENVDCVEFPDYRPTVNAWVDAVMKELPDAKEHVVAHIILKICSQTIGMQVGSDIIHGIEYVDGKFIVDCSDEYYIHHSVEVVL